ncbi:CVNH domain-containing protein [Echria macrotheca]|uniref:CVNH domain-containing protein n=1 Tax=Echria macrotheca TaxID=438768 RepID=A0AAJ0B5Z9_9PEZI|nr:CVNH domain-containing protein [Echria macrotheca]
MFPGNNTPYGQGRGEAASYYNDDRWQQQEYAAQTTGSPGYGRGQPPFSQQNQQFGYQPGLEQEGERGVLGAVGGGLAGGVGGHALGGKTGHSKLGTVLGVVGGALAGHKLQDGISDWKDKRDENRPQSSDDKHKPLGLGAHGVSYAGNFSGSSRDIRLDCSGSAYTLHASCKRMDKSYQASSIDLNRVLENDRGSFRWVDNTVRKNEGHDRPRQVTVQQGDTLRAIASRVGSSWEEMARFNGIANPDLIYPGQQLAVPGDAGHGHGHEGPKMGNFGMSARNVRLVDGGRRLEAELLSTDGQWRGSSIVLDERIGNENGTLTYVC